MTRVKSDRISAGHRIQVGLGLGLGVLASVMGCHRPVSGFIVPDHEVRAEVSTVAIAKITVPDVTAAPEEFRTLIETESARRLEAAGLTVVDTSVWNGLWRQSADQVGGLIDPVTRAVDEKRFEQVRDEVQGELGSQHGVDAVVQFSVEIVDSYGVLEEASACGGLTPVYWPGRWSGARATLVRTACLKVRVVDPSNRPLFGLRYPIEGIETFGRQTRATRPKEQTLRDPALIIEALDQVLTPFAVNARGRN
jgi:hypothetical protein